MKLKRLPILHITLILKSHNKAHYSKPTNFRNCKEYIPIFKNQNNSLIWFWNLVKNSKTEIVFLECTEYYWLVDKLDKIQYTWKPLVPQSILTDKHRIPSTYVIAFIKQNNHYTY